MRLLSVSVLFGTLVHELSHWLMAELLLVPTGKIHLIPEVQDDGGIRYGYAQVGKVGLLRSTIVGMAPFFFGLGILVGLRMMFDSVAIFSGWQYQVLFWFVYFQVSVTMFTSKKDLESAFVPVLFFGLVIFGLWYFKSEFFPLINGIFLQFVELMYPILGLSSLGVLGLLIVLRLLRRLVERVTRRNVVG